MTIKERINKKIQEYKDDFLNETGLTLIVIPKVALPILDIDKVETYICYFFDVKNLEGKTGNVSDAKQAFIAICEKMGYSDVTLANHLKLDRTTIVSAKTSFSNKITNISYRYKFYECLEYLFTNIGREDLIKNADWTRRTEDYNIIFAENELVSSTTKAIIPSESIKLAKEFSKKSKTRGVGNIVQSYIKENGKANVGELLGFLRSYGIYKDKKDSKLLSSVLHDMKTKNKITNIGRIWYSKVA